MIDSASETLISLAQAAGDLPRRRRGRKTHVSTLYRWATVGCRGVVLESIQIGASRCTSREALQRFYERLSAPIQAGVNPMTETMSPGRTVAQRQRAASEAGRKLAELGA